MSGETNWGDTALGRFLSEYLNEDWQEEYNKPINGIVDFLNSTDESEVMAVISDINNLQSLRYSDEKLSDVLWSELSCGVIPDDYDFTCNEWLDWLKEQLSSI